MEGRRVEGRMEGRRVRGWREGGWAGGGKEGGRVEGRRVGGWREVIIIIASHDVVDISWRCIDKLDRFTCLQHIII